MSLFERVLKLLQAFVPATDSSADGSTLIDDNDVWSELGGAEFMVMPQAGFSAMHEAKDPPAPSEP